MGIVNVTKTLSQSVGPVITGALAGNGRFWIAFVVAGSMKAMYDIGLLAFFVNHRMEGGGVEGHDGVITAANESVSEPSVDDPGLEVGRPDGTESVPERPATRPAH